MSSSHSSTLTHTTRPWKATIASGLELTGTLHGDHPDAPLILAVHGWLDNAASFDELGMRLSTHYRVLALDLPGHGLSQHPSKEGVYAFTSWCVWLDEVLAVLDEKRPVVLLGHSMGAAIVMCYAGVTDRHISRVIAIDGIAPATTDASETHTQLLRGLKSRRRALTRDVSRVASEEEAVEKMKAVRMPMSDGALHKIARRHLKRDDQGMYFGYDPMLQTTSVVRLSTAQLRACFSAISAPVHLIRAKQGWPIDEAHIKEVLSWIVTPVQIDLIDGGHHVHMDHPDDVSRIILDSN